MATFNMPAFGVSQSDVEGQQRQVDETNRQLQEAINRYDEASNKLAQLERDIDENKASLYKTGEELSVAMRTLNKRAKGIYKHGDISALEVIFNSKNLFDFVQRLDLLARIGESDAKLVRHVEATKRSLEAKGAELSAKVKEQEALTAQLEEEKNRIENDLALKQGILTSLQAELERIRSAGSSRRRPVGPIRISGFVFPVAGYHEHPSNDYMSGRTHHGNDIGAEVGTACVACVSGTVKLDPWSGNDNDRAGHTIYLYGNDGNVYVYMHLDGFAVGNGYVSAGNLIAWVGTTGTSGAWPHLHFEIHIGYWPNSIDPYPILSAAE